MSIKNLPQQIQIKIKSTHIDFINENYLLYTESAVKKGAKSWVDPYKKPVLRNHDKSIDPLGRVTGWEIVTTDAKNEPPKYVELTCTISDDSSIEKVLDGRYFTVSVGSKSNRVMCSECNRVINEDGLCEHKRGSYNEDGKPVYWKIDSIDYIEMSFVNEPADKYTGITHIDVGTGFIPYKNFLDNRESILSNIMEDSVMDNKYVKLSAEQRNKLVESSFCGPNKSFPAHDKAHVEAGLKLIDKITITDSTKSKIKSSLYRKGKKFGIVPNEDELKDNPDLLVYRISDNFSEEEITSIKDWFEKNPDTDLPESEEQQKPVENKDNVQTEKEISRMEKDELLAKYNSLKDEKEKREKELSDEIQSLKVQIAEKDTILTQREDEINKLVDESTVLDKKLKDSIISNIIDLKKIKGDEAVELSKKLATRKIDSLTDSLNDLRTESATEDSGEKIQNPVKVVDNSDKKQNTNEKNFDIFSQDNSIMLEAE